MGAAHALLGHEAGIACILGTGSNSCAYDGKSITQRVPSLGFLLGDEGSGVHIGKELIKAYFYGEMPANLSTAFADRFSIELPTVLDALYRKEKPGRFLASFTPFAGDYQHDQFVRQLIYKVFEAFIQVQLSKYIDYKAVPVSFTGSVAYYFKEILLECIQDHGIKTGKILASPAEGLIEYYRQI